METEGRMAEISREDLTELRESIQEQLRIGFEGTQQRQDDTNAWLKRVNGRTGKAEEAVAKLLERTDRLRFELDDHLHRHEHRREGETSPRAHERSDDGKPITRRDVAVGLGCAIVSIGSVLWVLQIAGRL
jgi:hypothetical protein